MRKMRLHGIIWLVKFKIDYLNHEKAVNEIIYRLQSFFCKKIKSPSKQTLLVTRARIELALPPWKGGVLTAWPTGRRSVGTADSFSNYLLSRAVTHQVSSTWKSLTSVFGMGTGGPSLLSSPNILLKAYTLKTKQQTIPWWFRLFFALRFSLILLLSSLDSLGQALGLLVPVSYTHYCASTSGLSTM